MRDCPICCKPWNGDIPSFQNHINQCLDGTSPPSPIASTSSNYLYSTTNDQDRDLQYALSIAEQDSVISSDQDLARALADEMSREATQDDAQLAQTLATTEQEVYRLGGDISEQQCPVCGIDLGFMEARRRDRHVLACIEGEGVTNHMEAPAPSDPEDTIPDEKGKSRAEDESNATAGIVPILADLLNRSSTRNAQLSSSRTIHFRGVRRDLLYSCGYRNFQMLFSAARHLPCYSSIAGDVPSIRQLQAIAERAWGHGFDPLGAEHFRGKLVGSKRWIGTTEIYVMFTWLGFRALIYDFPKATGPNGTHVGLTNFIQNYFSHSKSNDAFQSLNKSGGSHIRMCGEGKLPLYLQHKGHSRTVVGVETTKRGETNILVLDPGRALHYNLKKATAVHIHATEESSIPPDRMRTKLLQRLAPPHSVVAKNNLLADAENLLRPFRVSLKALSRNEQYQILVIEDGSPLTDIEKMERKEIRSTVVH
ncbi:DUF1671-domain-containing protein [Atractiella rhizophila]|nr:DUF1671-domain-containing protein [Atractiella rhizophila]